MKQVALWYLTIRADVCFKFVNKRIDIAVMCQVIIFAAFLVVLLVMMELATVASANEGSVQILNNIEMESI